MPSVNLNSGPAVSFLLLISTLVLTIVFCFNIYNQHKDSEDPKLKQLSNRFLTTGIMLSTAIGIIVLAILVIITTVGLSFLTNFGSFALGSLIGVSIIATILIVISFALYVTAFVYLWLGFIESLGTSVAPYALTASISFTVFLGFSAFSFMNNNAYLNLNTDTMTQRPMSTVDPSPFALKTMEPPRTVSNIIDAGDITNLKPKRL
jgi:hypothetical protein